MMLRKAALILILLLALPFWGLAADNVNRYRGMVYVEDNHFVPDVIEAVPMRGEISPKLSSKLRGFEAQEQTLSLRLFSALIAVGRNFEGGRFITIINVRNPTDETISHTSTFVSSRGQGFALQALIRVDDSAEAVGHGIVGSIGPGNVTEFQLLPIGGVENTLETGWVQFQLDPRAEVTVSFLNETATEDPIYFVDSNPLPLSRMSSFTIPLSPIEVSERGVEFRHWNGGIAFANPNADSAVNIIVEVTNLGTPLSMTFSVPPLASQSKFFTELFTEELANHNKKFSLVLRVSSNRPIVLMAMEAVSSPGAIDLNGRAPTILEDENGIPQLP